MPLTVGRVRIVDRTGGTVLHTSRTNPGNIKEEEVPDFVPQETRRFATGGKVDCTPHIIRVLDFLSVDAIHALRTTAGSHERICVVELFGRNSGETSLFAAYLADVDRAVISEVPFNMEKLARFIAEDRENNPSHYAIMTISEGAHFEQGTALESGEADAYGHKKLGGIGHEVAQQIKQRTGINIIYQQLAYIMRSGAPDSLDRMVAVSYGNLALDQVAMGHTGRMVALQQGIYTTVPPLTLWWPIRNKWT